MKYIKLKIVNIIQIGVLIKINKLIVMISQRIPK